MRTNTPHSPAKQRRHPAIFVPFHLPWDRPADYQRQTCLELAKTYPVFCVAENEPISLKAAFQLILHPTKHQAVLNQISSNKQQHLYWCRPIHFLPLQRWRSIKSLNLVFNIVLINLWWKWFSSKLELSSRLQVKPEKNHHISRRQILWIFDPQFVALLKWFKDWISVYDCVDFHSAAAPFNLQTQITKWETQLIQQATVFSVNSHALYTKHQWLRKPDLLAVQGFAYDAFTSTKPHTTKKKVVRERKPIIGFLGAINHRIDYKLLQSLAVKHPNWQFVLLGKIESQEQIVHEWQNQLTRTLQLSNVKHQPSQERAQLLTTLQEWSVGIIPYDCQQTFNQYCFPMKVFEYFYAGLPVISTPIAELSWYKSYVHIARSTQQFSDAIKNWLADPPNQATKKSMRLLAKKHSYHNKITAIINVIAQSNSE